MARGDRAREADEERRARVAGLTRQLFAEAGRLATVVSGRLGLNLTDVQAVRALDGAAEGPPTVSQLGARLGLSSAAVTGLVDRLESAGLVERVRDTRDRRKVFVHLSPRSQEVGREMMRPIASRIERAVEPLAAHELAVVEGFLERLVADAPGDP